MDDIQKRIGDIEKEIRETPYHKGTEHHIGKLRAKLAKLKDQVVERQAKKGGGGGVGFAVKQQGDATVVLVGFPSVGKSTLLNSLTNAESPVAEYSFTTLTVIPGMMKYKGAKILILDVPGLIEGASQGRGRGREVLSVVRSADMLLIMAEAGHEDDFRKIENELYANGVRINEPPPRVSIKKLSKGGLSVRSVVKQDFDLQTVREIAKEFGYINAEIAVKEKVSLERLIDAFAKNRVYVSALYVVNKIDIQKVPRVPRVPHVSPSFVPLGGTSEGRQAVRISAETGTGLEMLKQTIWEKLGLVRVYLRRPGKMPDYDDPMILRQGSSLSDVLKRIGAEFAKDKSGAKIWGPGAKFPGQKVSLPTPARDEIEVMFV